MSVMKEFPDNYKFIGISLWLDLDSTRYIRTTYTLFDWLA